jgi:hypothetical protein
MSTRDSPGLRSSTPHLVNAWPQAPTSFDRLRSTSCRSAAPFAASMVANSIAIPICYVKAESTRTRTILSRGSPARQPARHSQKKRGFPALSWEAPGPKLVERSHCVADGAAEWRRCTGHVGGLTKPNDVRRPETEITAPLIACGAFDPSRSWQAASGTRMRPLQSWASRERRRRSRPH